MKTVEVTLNDQEEALAVAYKTANNLTWKDMIMLFRKLNPWKEGTPYETRDVIGTPDGDIVIGAHT